MRYAPVALVLLAFGAGTSAFAGLNPNAYFALHARSGGGACNAADLPDCGTIFPTIDVAASTAYRMYFFLANVTSVAGFQTAFAWDAGWVIDPNQLGVTWLNCQANQLNAVTPADPGGPTSGTIATAFDCVAGLSIVYAGRMDFETGASGCLGQVQSTFPFGNHVVDCQQGQDEFDAATEPTRFGKVCIGAGGINGCPTAVEPSTWGNIKATYR